MSWREVTDDPNSEVALTQRSLQLASAEWRVVEDRAAFLIEACRGKRVLDVGCVDHVADAQSRATWLHHQLCGVATTCVGVDISRSGVDAMTAAGYDARCVDVTQSCASRDFAGRFDVVVAGEVIEHLGHPSALLDFGREALAGQGVVILTTPNPYAPWRVRSGRRRHAYENVDHVAYYFPSGIVELAERGGLRVGTIAVTRPPRVARSVAYSLRVALSAPVRRLRRKEGYRPGRLQLPFPHKWLSPFEQLLIRWQAGDRLVGETLIYVLSRS